MALRGGVELISRQERVPDAEIMVLTLARQPQRAIPEQEHR